MPRVGCDLRNDSSLIEPSPLPLPFVSSSDGGPCTVHTDCHIGLNERCFDSICTCGPSFSRSKSSDICELKKIMKVVLKFDSVNFSPEYNLPNSPGAIKLREKLESALGELVKTNSILNASVIEIKVINFSKSSFARGSLEPSSLSSNINMPNILEAECIISIGGHVTSKSERLQTVFVSEIVVAINQLNSSKYTDNPEYDMRVISLETNINPCNGEFGSNYCSSSANCIYNEKELSYTCSCGNKYTDTSPNSQMYPGEVCSLRCPDDYCSNDGYCHVDFENSLLYCTCNHWNVGSRCQYSGLVVFSVLGVIVFLLLLVVACAASAFCGRRSSVVGESGNILDHGLRYNNLSSPISPHAVISCDGMCHSHSHSHLLHKPSLLSSSTCPEDGHSVRPFRITIDNLNYGENSSTPGHEFGLQTQQNHLLENTNQGSSSNIQFGNSHNLTLSNPLIHSASPASPTSGSAPVSLANAIPTPSPRQSLMENSISRSDHSSTNAAIQTDSCELSQMNDQSVILLSPEVSLDKPPRGLPSRRRKEKQFSIDSTSEDRPPPPGQMSWC